MLKNRKIGTKVFISIGIMVVVISAVFAYTLYNLQIEKDHSETMQHQYVEGLNIAFEFKDDVADVMYNMRAYGLSGNLTYYEDGVASMTAAESVLEDFKVYKDNFPDNTILAEHYADAVKAHETYAQAIQDTYEAQVSKTEALARLNDVRATFMEEATAYYDDQVEKLSNQIQAYDTSQNLLDRRVKIELITSVINNVNEIRVNAFKAIGESDANLLETSATQFDSTIKDIETLSTLSKDAYNLEQLALISENAVNYKAKMQEIAAIYNELSDLGAIRLESGDALSSIAATLSSENLADIYAGAEETVNGVNNTTNVLIYGFIFALLIGVIFNVYIIRGVTKGIKGLTCAAETLATGDVDVELHASGKDEVATMTQAFVNMVDSIKAQANVAKQIAEGEKNIIVDVKSDKDILNIQLQDAVNSLNLLLGETDKLTKSVMKGELTLRGDETILKGVWNDLVKGINRLIDAFVNPINVTNDYITMLGKGELPDKIETTYYGDFNEIKMSINQCIDGISGLVNDTDTLINAAKEGNLSYRADASRHLGKYGAIVKGVNETLDAVTLPVLEASEVLKEMAKGNLKVRMNGAYKGDHNAIKQALNSTLTSLVGYIDEISLVLGKMAEGDLTINVSRAFEGDFIKIQQALNNILGSLNRILGDINISAEQVNSGATQVSASSQALSQGSTEQASSVEEITSAITQVAEQTKENALNANKANALAVKAKDGAVSGNDQMQNMVDAMREINASSQNISKIIKVIDEIAFQTNILALNAAVEAARAGEHGKGFAVVAEEVRNLAARSANAAKETTGLIENSINKVESGTDIANVTAKSLAEIVEGVSEVAELVSTISNASNEQAIAISQINEGVNQISDVTQNNTATAEETAAASEEMSAQAELLKEMISRFDLVTGTGLVSRAKSSKPKQNNYESSDYQPPKTIDLDDTDFGKY